MCRWPGLSPRQAPVWRFCYNEGMKRTALTLVMLGWAMFAFSLAWGQEYGAMLDSTEQQAMAETFQYALENNPINEASAWVNPDTQRSGTVVPVRTFQNSAGQYCREFVTTIMIGGHEEQAYGTACRQSDGSWLIVPAEGTADSYQVVEKVIEKHYVYPYGYRDWYAYHPYYYYPWYHAPRIFFSFNIVHFVGTRHVKVHPGHVHGVHHHKHFKDWRGKHSDGIIRSHPGRVGGGSRDFRGTQDFRSLKEDRGIRSGGSSGGRDFQDRGNFRGNRDDRGVRSGGGGSSGGRDFQGRGDFRGGRDDRGIRSGGGSGSGRDFQNRRDFRGLKDSRGTGSGVEGRQFRGGQRDFGDRSQGGQRSGRR